MTKGVLIKPDIMKWAIRASNKNINALIEKFDKIELWTIKESEITVGQLNKLSKELKIPFGYFFLQNPPEEKISLLQCRTIENLDIAQPSRDLIDTIRTMETKQEYMRDFIIEDGHQPLKFVGSASENDNPVELAVEIRRTLGLHKGWNEDNSEVFNTLREAISRVGILVMQNGVVGSNNKRVLDLTEFRAFVLIDEYAPLIFLNAKDSYTGRLFSLCHELVHIWLGTDELFNDNDQLSKLVNNKKMENFCNQVAAELLIPSEDLIKFKSEDIYFDIIRMAKKYGVSQLVVCNKVKR